MPRQPRDEDRTVPPPDAYEEVAWQLVSVLPEKIAAAPLNQLAVSLGIAIDKARLIRGQPTSYNQNDNRNLNANAVLDKFVDLLTAEQRDKLRELFGGHDSGGEGRSEARLPETSGVPLLERELPSGREVVPDQ